MPKTITQRALINELFSAAVKAAAPNDPTGHLLNCGYTDEIQECDCAEYGKRLYDNVKSVVDRYYAECRERVE